MTTTDQIRAFLLDRKALLPPVSQIARLSSIRPATLRMFVNGVKYRHLTPEQVYKLIPVLEKMGFKLLK